MVSRTRASLPSAQLQPLNRALPVRVEARGGLPRAVYLGPEGRNRLKVIQIRDRWRIDDEWWRHPLSRWYFQLVLSDGRCLTLYKDLVTGEWKRQNY